MLAVAALAIAGCGPAPAPPEAGAPEGGDAPSASDTETMTMESMDLVMYDTSVSEGKRPSIIVHADHGSLMTPEDTEEKPAWTLKGARAEIFRNNVQELVLEAASGMFDESKGVARLEGGVTMRSNEFDMDLERVEWDNEKRLAQSDTAVTIRRGDTSIEADGFALNPDERSMTLDNVSGWLDFTAAPQEKM